MTTTDENHSDAIDATDTMTPRIDDLPSDLAEEMATLADADRRVAERISNMPEIEPPEGFEDRAVEAARRRGLLQSSRPAT